MTGVQPIRLLAQDAADLEVISDALQDAVAQVGELEWDARGRRFTLALHRYCWEAPGDTLGLRVRAGLQFGGVLAVKSRNLRREPPELIVELMGMMFEPGDPPGGEVRLLFADGGAVVLTVECIDAALVDLSAPEPIPGAPADEGADESA